jgi:hypothetical protein
MDVEPLEREVGLVVFIFPEFFIFGRDDVFRV